MPGLSTSRLELLSATTLFAIATAGCQPEVLIASNEPEMAGMGGGVAGTGTGGSGAGGAGGTSDVPPIAGDAGAAAVPEPPRLLADSVADFSLNQGELGWWYGYDGGSLDSFTLMTKESTITAYMPVSKDTWKCWANETAHWTQIFQFGAHPNGTITSAPVNAVLQRAVRRWVSTFAGPVIITGEIAKIDVTVNGSNGVDASVYVDGGLPVYTTTIGGEDGGGRSYRIQTTLQLNSTVDFVLDPLEGDDRHDLSRFTAVIARAEP
jgi:hypothetical protein